MEGLLPISSSKSRHSRWCCDRGGIGVQGRRARAHGQAAVCSVVRSTVPAHAHNSGAERARLEARQCGVATHFLV